MAEQPNHLPSLDSTMALIASRRSIMPKDLSGEPLQRTEVEKLLEAANWAPTHHRNEPWRFAVVEGPEGISAYLDMLDAWYSEHREDLDQQTYLRFLSKLESVRKTWVGQPSHLVVLGMVRAAKGHKAPEWEEIAAVGCAVQNFHLALTSIPGAGGFWSSHNWCSDARDSEMMRKFVGLDDPEDRVFGAFVMGKVNEGKSFKGRRGDWREKVKWVQL